MNKRRRARIESLLARGGAIHHRSEEGVYRILHPDGDSWTVKNEEAAELLNEGALVTITCGCNGFWWALRPDLVAAYSTPKKEKTN